MICRVWRGWTTPENAEAYQALLKGEIMPGIRAQDISGLLAHQALRRSVSTPEGVDEVEHMTLIWFRRIEDVEGFVGPNYEKANMPSAAAAVLSRWDKAVVHYEVFDNPDHLAEPA